MMEIYHAGGITFPSILPERFDDNKMQSIISGVLSIWPLFDHVVCGLQMCSVYNHLLDAVVPNWRHWIENSKFVAHTSNLVDNYVHSTGGMQYLRAIPVLSQSPGTVTDAARFDYEHYPNASIHIFKDVPTIKGSPAFLRTPGMVFPSYTLTNSTVAGARFPMLDFATVQMHNEVSQAMRSFFDSNTLNGKPLGVVHIKEYLDAARYAASPLDIIALYPTVQSYDRVLHTYTVPIPKPSRGDLKMFYCALYGMQVLHASGYVPYSDTYSDDVKAKAFHSSGLSVLGLGFSSNNATLIRILTGVKVSSTSMSGGPSVTSVDVDNSPNVGRTALMISDMNQNTVHDLISQLNYIVAQPAAVRIFKVNTVCQELIYILDDYINFANNEYAVAVFINPFSRVSSTERYFIIYPSARKVFMDFPSCNDLIYLSVCSGNTFYTHTYEWENRPVTDFLNRCGPFRYTTVAKDPYSAAEFGLNLAPMVTFSGTEVFTIGGVFDVASQWLTSRTGGRVFERDYSFQMVMPVTGADSNPALNWGLTGSQLLRTIVMHHAASYTIKQLKPATVSIIGFRSVYDLTIVALACPDAVITIYSDTNLGAQLSNIPNINYGGLYSPSVNIPDDLIVAFNAFEFCSPADLTRHPGKKLMNYWITPSTIFEDAASLSDTFVYQDKVYENGAISKKYSPQPGSTTIAIYLDDVYSALIKSGVTPSADVMNYILCTLRGQPLVYW